MLRQLLDHRKKGDWDAEVLPFFSMVDRRKALHREVCAAAREEGIGFLEAEIPYSSLIERVAVERRPVAEFSPRSAAARAYVELWNEYLARRGVKIKRGPVGRLLDRMIGPKIASAPQQPG